MEKTSIVLAVCSSIVLVLLLLIFLLFILFIQRAKSNKFINEREVMKLNFNEQILRAQLEIQEQSFNAISMEIHDNVGQTLSLLKVQLNIIDQQQVLDRKILAEVKINAGKVMTDLRDIAKSLSSDRIIHDTLAEMATHELQRISNTGIMKVSMNSLGEERPVSDQKKLIVFRILQECFQNIVKHSGGDTTKVFFIYQLNDLKITIEDNGKGFDEGSVKTRSAGLGMQNMINRAAIIGGSAQINSIINKGTTIIITTPYE
jgi:two-component system NarL family sensor kinase